MSKKILIVEDEFIVANDLSIMLENAGYDVCDVADSVEEAREIIARQKPQLVLLDIHLKGKLTGIDLARQLRDEQIAFVYLSANSNQKILEEAKATEPYGFMVKPFREKDVLVSLEIAWYLHEQNISAKRVSEQLLQSALIDILAENADWRQKFLKIAKALQPYVPFDYLAIATGDLDNPGEVGIRFLRTGFNDYQVIGIDELMNISGLKKAELLKLQPGSGTDTFSTLYNSDDFLESCRNDASKRFVSKTFEMRSNLVMYVPVTGGRGLSFSFYSRKSDIYNNRHLVLVNKLQRLLSPAVDEILAGQKKMRPAERERGHKAVALAAPVKGFDGIMGSSHLLLTALDLLTLVAPTETSVLILGESGTGKERFAKTIHSYSARSKKQLVVVNCAALPAHLIESELFGHEKGAFTGAVEMRKGKFEQATGGTIFLDEIGELPLESQSKLLRVLQEKEIERLGGKETIRVDVRIIAATNCNLEKEVAAGKFRLDLYYRLNIFPIVLPSLRDRKEDIPELAEFFIRRYAERAGKKEMILSPQALVDLSQYNWPGNVRELEHLIERNVLLNRGNVIDRISLPNITASTQPSVASERIKTIDDNEREYILSVLKKCNGRISGPGGAAELLDVPSTTLNSKMKRLGITRKQVGGY
jgi:DNA-binding NtrC family response regulator